MDTTPALPPPGRMIDIGTHQLHLYSLGEGTPVVVLDAGSGDNILSWHSVQAEIARFTQLVAYDRAGLGWSERGTAPRTGANIVRDLYHLLTTANLPAPYVLVGHSMGGVHVRMFAQEYPDLVAGMVLVDSSHEQQVAPFKQAIPGYGEVIDGYLDMMKSLPQKSQAEILAVFEAAGMSASEESPELAALERDRVRPETVAVMLEEMELANVILDQPDGYARDLGSLPLRVLTGTRPIMAPGVTAEDGAHMLEIFQGLQREIAERSTHGEQTLVPDAGHYIQKDQPQVVIDAIREVVELVRQTRP